MATSDNLVVGAARLLVGTAGSTLTSSDLSTLAAGNTPSGWTDLGHTTSSVALKDNPSYVKATSQQAARTLDVAVSEIETTITTTLREVSAGKLAAFLRGTNTSGTVTPGGIGTTQKFACAVYGPGPSTNKILFSAPRCVYVGERTVSFDAENYTAVEVTIEILDDTTTGGYTIYVAAPTVAP